MLRKLFTKISAVTLVLLSLSQFQNALAQEYYDLTNTPRQYYYNNFESATAGTPSTYFAAGGSTRSSAFMDIVSNSSLNGTKSLSTTGGNTLGTVTFNFLANSATGTNTSLANAPWEWEFDYKNTTGGSTTDPDSYNGSVNDGNMVAGTNSWRYWLISYLSGGTRLGLYVSQVGGNLVIRRKYDVPGTQYQTLYSVSMPNNTDTYQIRMIRSVNGYFNVYILNRTTNTTVSSTLLNISHSALNVYNLSYLEATSTTANRFQFDNFNFYQARVDYIPITPTASNGMTTVIYPGIVNAVPYAVNVNVRGDIVMGRFVINFSGNAGNIGQALFTSGAIYKTTGNVFSVSTGTKLGNDVAVNGTNTQQTDFSQINPPEYYYSPGNTNGTTANVVKYFFVAQGRNPFFNGYPTTITYSVSTTNSDTFSQFFNSVSPFGAGSSSSVSSPGINGDLYDWTGANTSWTESGSWNRNLASSTANPSGSSDIVRIGVVPYSGSNQPAMYGNTTIGRLIFGSNNSPALTLSNNRVLTATNGVELQSNTTATITGGGANTSFTISSGATSSIPSGSTLVIANKADFNNGGTFTSEGNLTLGDGFTNTSTGTFTATAGTVTFNGTVADQSITNSANTAVTFYNATFGNTSNATRSKTLNSGSFNIAAGGVVTLSGNTTLVTGGLLTLKSNATGTAGVASIPTTAGITGNVNVERYVTGGTLAYRGYRLFSSPVYEATVNNNNIYGVAYTKNSAYITGTSGTAGGFDVASSTPTMYLYREDKAASSSATGGNFRGINKINNSPTYNLNLDNETGTFNIPVGNGFMFFFRGDRATNSSTSTTVIPDAVVFSNTGTLNQGDIDVKLWYTPTSGTLGRVNTRYHLVGNPYASTIDWNTFSSTSSGSAIYGPNLSNTIYVYNSAAKTYATYDGSSATNGGSRYIPSGQGFFVMTNTTGVASLKFREAAKAANQQVTGLNLLMAKAKVTETVLPAFLKIELAKDAINKEDMVIKFDKAASPNNIFNEDSPYFQGSSAVNLYSISADNVNLAINTMPLTDKPQTIPLFANVNATGNYKLALTEINRVPEMLDVWLKDAYTSDSVNLRETTVYNFAADRGIAASFGSGRFTLVIRPNSGKLYRLVSFDASATKARVDLTWTTENEENNTYFTLERSINNGETFEVINSTKSSYLGTYNFVDRLPVTGQNLYRLKQEDQFGNITYSTLLPVMFTPGKNIANSVTVFPNPASTVINIGITPPAGTSVSTYKIMVSNTSGKIVKQVTTTTTEWQDTVTELLPGAYFIRVVNNDTKKEVGRTTFVKI